jgi:hypothetical protein
MAEQVKTSTTPFHTPRAYVEPKMGMGAKLLFALVAIVLLAVLGYIIGAVVGKSAVQSSPMPSPTTSPAAVIEPSSSNGNPLSGANATPSPTALSPIGVEQSALKTEHAGMQSGVFTPYSVTINPGWSDTHTTDTSAKIDTLKITKGDYTVTISQAAGGSGVCLYPGSSPQPMAQMFNAEVGIPGLHAQYRRGTNDGTNFTICEMRNNQYVFPTEFGNITYSTPGSPDLTTLNDMDAMVASLAK